MRRGKPIEIRLRSWVSSLFWFEFEVQALKRPPIRVGVMNVPPDLPASDVSAGAKIPVTAVKTPTLRGCREDPILDAEEGLMCSAGASWMRLLSLNARV
jgi:hypothetical protein